MNVRIKTAHGYLSFQPDGRIEYRAVAGSWENIDIEGLVLETSTPDAPPPPPPSDYDQDAAPTARYVDIVKQRCLAAGIALSGPCGAFAITKRVAWGLRNSGAGLLSKPSGNNCEGYATDIICYPSGRIVDILGDGGNANNTQWAEGEDVEATRYRPAVKP